MKKRLLILAATLLMALPFSASAARHFVVVGRPYYYGGWYAPYWGPYWGGYWGGWVPGYGYYYNPNSGDVKIDTKVKEAQVFIDGSYAGTTHDNKTMHLRPGSYNIEIRQNGQTAFNERVYVVRGKTLHLHPEL